MTSRLPKASPPSDTTWNANELETLGFCPVCQSKARRVIYQGLKDNLFGCPGSWTLHGCKACGTAYLDPRPTPASIGKAYAEYLTHPKAAHNSADQKITDRGSLLRTFVRATLNSYLNARWQMTLAPSNTWGRHLVPWLSPARKLVEQQMRHMPPQPLNRQGRLLDVGCGNGAFLELAQKAGWSVHGIDFDPIAVATARNAGLEIDLGSVDKLVAQVQTYDWITCSHVLEHVHEPQKLLQSMRQLLSPGGTLWLQTPNVDSIGHKTYGSNWRGLEPPRHLTLMTEQTLRKALETVGFKTKFERMPLFSAVNVYAMSSASRRGEKNIRPLPRLQTLRLHFLLLSVIQSRSLRHAEFHTVIATS